MQMGEPYLGSRPEPMSFDTESVRSDFPLIVDSNLVYLDNAATTQKPAAVLDAMRWYYEHENANVHRGVHRLSQEATEAYEVARDTARRRMGAEDAAEIVFVRGATEAINLVASSSIWVSSTPRQRAADKDQYHQCRLVVHVLQAGSSPINPMPDSRCLFD